MGSPTTAARFNTFWIAANLIFDLETGEAKEVLLLVNRIDDATVFKRADAEKYMDFIMVKARGVRSGISWAIDPVLPTPEEASSRPSLPPLATMRRYGEPDRFVIKGVQYAS